MQTAKQPTFEELYAQYGDGLYRYCFRLCRGNEADAEDLAQETLILAFRHLEGFKGKSKVQTWLYRIALNVHLKRRGKGPVEDDEPIDSHEPGVDPTGGQLTRLWLESGLSALPDALYQAIVLVKAEGLTHKEAAAVLGVPQGTVQFRVHEAVKRLRKILTEDPRSPYVGAFVPAGLLDTELAKWANVTAPPSLQANVLEAIRNPPVGGYPADLPAALRPSAARGPLLDRRTLLAGGGLIGLLLGGLAVVKSKSLLPPANEVERTMRVMRAVRTARASGTYFNSDVARTKAVNIRRYTTEFAFRDPAGLVRRLTPIPGGIVTYPEELIIDGARTTISQARQDGTWRTMTTPAGPTTNMAAFDLFTGFSNLGQALDGGASVSTTSGTLAGEPVFISTVQRQETAMRRSWVLHTSPQTGRVLRCEYVHELLAEKTWLQSSYTLLDSWEYDMDLPETIFRPTSRPPSE